MVFLDISQNPQENTCARTGPYLNTLCVQHSDASPLLKSHEKFVWPEKLQKHI